MAKQITVLIADDHPIFRSGVRQALERQSELTILAEAENGEEAFQKIMDLKPDIAILDIQMPKMTGLTIAQRLERMGSETKVILLTMLDDKKIFLEAMDTGVLGYVLKDSAVSELVRAIPVVYESRHYVSPQLAGLLVQKRSKGGREASAVLKNLTPAELKILRLIADLKNNTEIADELAISHRTVENHRVNIAKKLNLETSKALLKFALQHQADLE